MARTLTQLELLQELAPVAEDNVNRHLKHARDWNPHDYVPWDEGQNFAALGGTDYDPEQSQLDEVAKASMITNLLTEDNLPSYHRVIADNFSMDSAWGHWVGRWTAEENRHGIVMRDYLVVVPVLAQPRSNITPTVSIHSWAGASIVPNSAAFRHHCMAAVPNSNGLYTSSSRLHRPSPA